MSKIYITSITLFITLFIMKAQNLQFKEGENFKIVQFTDVHYKPGVLASDTSILLISEILDAEDPDLVVFTGDIAWAKPTKECFDKVLNPVINRKIPWAFVNGNHDDEHDLNRTQLIDYLVDLPYSLTKSGPKHIMGEGNYIVELRASEDINKVSTLLYFFDSGSYNQQHSKVGWSYAWFSHEQIEWYRKESKAYTLQNNNKPHRALAFFHIPLAEYSIMSANKENIVGNYNEEECNGKINTGMFAAMVESEDVVGTFVGHDHDNDYIGSYMGIALAYGRFSGGNTVYNNLGTNGCRVINLSENEKGFSTYIHLRGGEKKFFVEFPNYFNE